MEKIVVLGSSGMLGHVLCKHLCSLGKYIVYSSAGRRKISDETCLLDLRDWRKVKEYLLRINPKVVINCAGLLIEESKKRVEDAIVINSLLPHQLSRLGREVDFKLIQIGTDCVFSGKTGEYLEDSIQDGTSVYARTKALGEIINDKDLTIRTSIIGPELKPKGLGLLHWFLNQKGEIYGYKNVFWTGVTTLELAKAIEQFIEQDIAGLYNLVPDQKISKYNLLLLFQTIWQKKDIIIKPYQSIQSDKSLINSRTDFNYNVKDYKEMLLELYEWMEYNKNFKYDYKSVSP